MKMLKTIPWHRYELPWHRLHGWFFAWYYLIILLPKWFEERHHSSGNFPSIIRLAEEVPKVGNRDFWFLGLLREVVFF